MSGVDIIAIIGALIGSGGIAAIITAWATKKKNKADAEATNIKSILEIDARLNERISSLEEKVAFLEKENFELKQKELRLNYENKKYKEKLEELRLENQELNKEIIKLKEKINNLTINNTKE